MKKNKKFEKFLKKKYIKQIQKKHKINREGSIW